ncbi:MAG TPA: penicillin acylase family protein, partial [Pseudomonadales bacterium]|nr:penicillin acylase family protein [Pseudomonadales bacterium]
MHKFNLGWAVFLAAVCLNGCKDTSEKTTPATHNRAQVANGEASRIKENNIVTPIVDSARYAWSILPPGNGNQSGFTSAYRYDELKMYDDVDNALVDGTLNESTLSHFYKDSHLGVQTRSHTEQSPKSGVSIQWDDFGVPHVFAEKAEDVAYGAGFATAEARNVMAELIRAMGKSGLVELGTDPSKIFDHFEEVIKKPAINYSKAELTA